MKYINKTNDSGMSLGEGIATAAAIIVLSPVILIEGLKSLFD